MGWLRRTPATFDPDTGLETRAPTPAPAPPPGVERRDPQVATQVLGWQRVGAPMIPEFDGEQSVRFAYIANTYAYRCVQVIARAIAGCPVRAGTDPTTRAEYDLEAPLAQLLGPPPGGPNPNLSPRRMWAWTVAQRLIHGRWCWEIERSGQTTGKVQGLWPLPVSKIAPVNSEGGRRYFDGFVFANNTPQKKILAPEQVVYDWEPSQLDIRQPESVLQAARLDISVAVMQDRYDVAFLRNDARPAAVIVHEEFAEPDEREAFRQQFLAEHRGVDNAGKPVFVEAEAGLQGVDKTFHVEVLGLSQRDAEFIARYEKKIRAICVAFGTPLSILGDASGRTFDNAGREYRNWWEGTLLPLLAELEDAVNMQLAPALGREVMWFDTGHVEALKAPSLFVALGQPLVALKSAGIITADEARAELKLGPAGPAPAADQPVAPSSGAGADHQAEADAAAEDATNVGSVNGRAFDGFEVRRRVRVVPDDEGRFVVEPVRVGSAA